jgi:hypothetical protein
MRNMAARFRMTMAAAAFAEAAEWETARQLAPEAERKCRITWWDRMFMEITFAEHGLRADTAEGAGCRGGRPAHDRGDDLCGLGLQGVHMTFGVIQVEAEYR